MGAPIRLVLVHGSFLSGAQWLGYADRLGPDVEVVAPDLPGHGSRRGERFDWERATAVIGEAASASSGQRVVIAGHSLGGYLAAAVAARHSNAVSGLGLLGATAEPRGVGAAAYQGLARLYGVVGHDRAGRGVLRQLRVLGVDPEVVDALDRAGLALEAAETAWPSVIEHGGAHQLDGFRGTVLLLAGQFDQLRIGMPHFARVGRLSARQVREVVLPRAAHVFPLTHPARTAAELAWLCSATMEGP